MKYEVVKLAETVMSYLPKDKTAFSLNGVCIATQEEQCQKRNPLPAWLLTQKKENKNA